MENPEAGLKENVSPPESIQGERQTWSSSGQATVADITEEVREQMKNMILQKPDENVPSEESGDVFESNKEQENISQDTSEIQNTPVKSKIGEAILDLPTESASGSARSDSLPYVEQISQACEQLTDICTNIAILAPSLENFISLVPKTFLDQQETCSRLAAISIKLSALSLQLSSSSWKLTVLLKTLTVTPAKIKHSTDKLIELIEVMQTCTNTMSKEMKNVHEHHFGNSANEQLPGGNPADEDVLMEIKKGYEMAEICSKELDVTVAQFQSAKGMEMEFNEACEIDQSELDAFLEACKNPPTDW